ncbi:MAG: chitobiase/beta-hexosaminidase C-terminal domain-containing protein [Bacteroidales bacterium]
MNYKRFIPLILFIGSLLPLGTHSLSAQEASRCPLIISGRDTLSSPTFYFTRSMELRLISPSPNSTIYYTLDGSPAERTSPSYTSPLLLSQSAILNILSVEMGRKESRCNRVQLRRIQGIESVTLHAHEFIARNGNILSLFDSLPAPFIQIPAKANEITLIINRGIATGADSIRLNVNPDLKDEIRSIDIFLSRDGKKYFRPDKRGANKADIKQAETITIYTAGEVFRYIKWEIRLRKAQNANPRILPLSSIQIFSEINS